MSRLRTLLRDCVALCAVLCCASAAAQGIPELRFTVDRFVVEGDNPLSASETDAVLSPFLGEQRGLEGLQNAAQALERALGDKGYGFHRVVVPPQEALGTFRLRVLAFTVNRIQVKENQHFSAENILRSLPPLQSGAVPNERVFGRAISLANDHPAKRVDVLLRKGEVPDSLDADVVVHDSSPLQVFAGINNTGSSDTGRWRVSAGVQHSNLFDLDNVLTASYTTSPEHPNDVEQYGAHYRVPVYDLGGAVTAFAVYSNVNTGNVGGFDVSGSGEFYGIEYAQTLLPLGDWSHRLSVGVEDKLFSEEVRLTGSGGAALGLVPDVRSRPLTIEYSGRLEKGWGEASLAIAFAANLPDNAKNTDDAYAASRAGASKDWNRVTAGATVSRRFANNAAVSARMTAQATGEPLISGEQFGIGGANSVRGLDEREVAGDSGVQASVEFWAPPLPWDIRVLAFYDWGMVRRQDPLPGEIGKQSVSSVGAGMRWQWQRNLLVSLDYGYVLDGSANIDGSDNSTHGSSRVHASMLLRY